MRILGIDPGEKNIGIAISDPTGTTASPLTVLKHISRPLDAARIADLAQENNAGLIVIGLSVNEEGEDTVQTRQARRLVEAIHLQCEIPIRMWEESFSTQEARQTRIMMGINRKKRRGHLDDLAATIILQDYLNSRRQS